MAFGSISTVPYSSSSLLPSKSHAESIIKPSPSRIPSRSRWTSKSRPNPKISAEIDADGSLDRFSELNSISDFMRFKRGGGRGSGGGGTGELQTAVVRYRKKFPWSLLQPFLQVDLVSTIHIADKEYFETLQKGLEMYDCVLYEMVASKEILESRKNLVPSKKLKETRSKGFSILGFIQRQMARILALDFQLDCINYLGENWLHADLDFETFKLLQLERGESLFTFARDMTLRSTKALVQSVSVPENLGPWRSKLLWMSRVLPMPLVGLLIIGSVCSPPENQSIEYPELEALSRLDIGAALKIFLARRLTSEFTQLTTEVEEKSVIIGERNRVASEVLRSAIDGGYQRIAVLYGGGHMPDLGRRLREEFNMVPSEVQWVTAWSITNRELDSRSFPFLKTMAELSGWPLNRYQTLALVIFSSVLAVDLWFWELFFGTVVNWASWAASAVNLLPDDILQEGSGHSPSLHESLIIASVPNWASLAASAVNLLIYGMLQDGKEQSVMVHEGLITESLPNGMFRVRLSNEEVILGHISGKIRKSFIRILPGDRVKIEVSRYDSSRGRITYRLRNKE